MRMARRLGLWRGTQTKKAFVWEVYESTVSVVEMSDETSFTGSTSAYCMVADEYTVDANGFTLVNATQTSMQNIAKGQYFVTAPANSGSSAIKGQYLYECTDYSTNGWQGILYVQKYGIEVSRGSEVLSTVSSDALDYPIDGAQGDKWYILVENNSPLYIYGKYTVQKVAVQNGSGYKTQTDLSPRTIVYAAGSYTIEEGTSKYQFVLTSPTQKQLTNAKGQYIVSFTSSNTAKGNTLYYLQSVPSALESSGTARYYEYVVGDGQGDFMNYVTAESATYPSSGVQGDYWYVLLSSPNK